MGLGFTISPLFFVANQIAEGKLVEVLPGIRPHIAPLFLVTNEQVRDSLKAQAVQNVLFAHLSTVPGIHLSPDVEQKRKQVA